MDESPPPAPDLEGDAVSGGDASEAPPAWQPRAARPWHVFRRLPWWGQLIGWLLGWWILPAAWLLARARDGGGVLAAGIVALFGTAIMATAVGDDPAGDIRPATTATDLETTPAAGPAARSPTATTSPTPDRTPTPPTRATTTAPTPVTPSPEGSPPNAVPPTSPAVDPTTEPDATSGIGTSTERDGEVMTVERIVDGDTLYLSGLPERARLIGIDTPETVAPDSPVECFGPEATGHLTELVPPGSEVVVTFDVERIDQYDRPLVYLYRASDDLFVNEAMLADGYAQVVTHPPNVAHVDVFRNAQASAREDGLGLWSADCGEATDDPSTVPPPPTDNGGADVTIATIEYDGPGNDVEYDDSEYVALANGSGSSVDVAGWSLTDEVGHRIVIPSGYAIPGGGTLRVYTGPGNDTTTRYFHGATQAIWNNSGGDTATLHDAGGAVVDQFSYSS